VAGDGIIRAADGEYESFLADVASAVGDAVEPWRARIAEALAAWSAAGYRVDVLERAMRLPGPPDVDGLLATFALAADHLASLERRARAVDPALGGDAVFRDPERVADAEALVERVMAGAAPLPAPPADLHAVAREVGAPNELAVRAAGPGGIRGSSPIPAFAPTATPGGVVDPFFLDEEKVVWEWPDAGGRLIEELR